MEEVKKDKTSCNIIIIIILMIMVLGLGGYIFYDKVMSKDSDVTNPKTEEKVSLDKVKSIYKLVLDKDTNKVNSLQIKTGLFDYISEVYEESDTKSEITLYDYYDYSNKMAIAYEQLESKDITSTKSDKETSITTEQFSIDAIKTAYLNVFGKDKSFEAKDFKNPVRGDCTCKVNDKLYVCTYGPYGGTWSGTSLLTAYDKYEVSDDILYVYEYVIYSHEATDGNTTYSLSSSSTDKIIDDFTNKSGDILLNEENYQYFNYYKLSFKKNVDGTYYWYNITKVNK